MNNKADYLHKFLNLALQSDSIGFGFYAELVKQLQYRVLFLERERAFGLYSFRRDVVDRTEEQLNQFDELLGNMSKYEGEKVIIHGFIFVDKVYLFFTGIDLNDYFGCIIAPASEENI